MSQISDTERTQRLKAARTKIGRPGLRLLGACLPRTLAPLASAVRTFGKATVLAGSVFAGSAALPSSQAHAFDIGQILGGVIGGALASNIGSGSGRELATGVGAVIGALAMSPPRPSRARVPVYAEPSSTRQVPAGGLGSLGVPVHKQYGPMVDAYAMKDGHSGSQHYLMQCVVWQRSESVRCVRQAFNTAQARDVAEQRMNHVYDQRFGR